MVEEKKIENILIDDIIPNRFQPRLKFDEAELNNLADSIRIHGIIQPLVLRKLNDKYEVIAGERRLKASQIVGLKQVPAIVIEADDNTSAELAVIENLQRKDLSAIEEAKSFKKLLDRGYANQEELAKKLGVSQSAISNKLRLLNLPEEVQNALLENRISERHARSLLALKDSSDQIYMLDKIINNRLTVKQTDKEINDLLQKSNVTTDSKTIESTPIENISDFFNTSYVSNDNNETIDSEKNERNNIDYNIESSTEISQNQNEEKSEKDFDLEDLLKAEPIPIKELKSENIQNEKENEMPNIEQNKERKLSVEENKLEKKEDVENTNILKQETFKNTEIFDNLNNQINPFQENVNETSNLLDSKNDSSENHNFTEKNEKAAKKDIISVINNARNTVKNIERAGFEVDTEEFDFEDMYQIIIKIKK